MKWKNMMKVIFSIILSQKLSVIWLNLGKCKKQSCTFHCSHKMLHGGRKCKSSCNSFVCNYSNGTKWLLFTNVYMQTEFSLMFWRTRVVQTKRELEVEKERRKSLWGRRTSERDRRRGWNKESDRSTKEWGLQDKRGMVSTGIKR